MTDLPAEGSVTPYFGQLGVLRDDGTKVECHVCGRWYGFLGMHVVKSHGMTVRDYKAAFGLRFKTGLAGPRNRALHRRLAAVTKGFVEQQGRGPAMSMLKATRQEIQRNRRHSLEERQRNGERRRKTEIRQCEVCGNPWIAVGKEARKRRTCSITCRWRLMVRSREATLHERA